MSEEVKTADVLPPPPSTEILPAKSEDKLEIEKEEQEKKPEEKEEGGGDDKKEEEEGDKKEEGKQAAATGGGGGGGGRKKRGKKKVQLKAPKVPAFLRGKSKERKKEEEEAKETEEGKKEDKKEEEKEQQEKEDKSEDKKEGETEVKTEGGDDKEEKKEDAKEGGEEATAAEESEEKKEDVAAAEKEQSKLGKLLDNVHMPKMPKFSKPKFMKKAEESKAEEEPKETELKDMKSVEEKKEEGEEKKDEEGEEKKEDEEKKEGEEKKEEKEEEKKGFLDSLKSSVPAMFSRKPKEKKSDAEMGDKEEAKELLEKKEEGGEETTTEKKEQEEGEKEEKKEEEQETKEDKEEAPKARTGFLDSLRNVANHVPALFARKPKDATDDVEAQETKELLLDKDDDAKEDSNKKEDDLDEVKVVDDAKKDPDAASGSGSEKKDDPEKAKEPCRQLQQIRALKDRLCAAVDHRQRRCALGVVLALALLLLLVVTVTVGVRSGGWDNDASISDDGKYIETHTVCGPVQGLVDGPDMFSFRRIPYAADPGRFRHSRPSVSLAECYDGRFVAHAHNDTGRCWRRHPSGKAAGVEDCLTLDIFTGSVVVAAKELLPVVVYVDGDDLEMEQEESLRPSSALAKEHGVVFVDLRYRRGVLGFLSLQSLSRRSYPHTSGNYGLGDVVSALKWVALNVQHFGGHPKKVTLLGRGSGATLVTALTASPAAKGLFDKVWATNGAGVFANVSARKANSENKVVLNTLKCGADEVSCITAAAPDALTLSAPSAWYETNLPDLPMEGDPAEQHSWLVADKALLFLDPREYWKKHRLTNNVKVVFGATAQGEVTADNLAFMDWNDTDAFTAHVEGRLGSFNATLPAQALDLYNKSSSSSNWAIFASMVTDIRTVCPLQDLALAASNNFVANVYFYVATAPRATADVGKIAHRTADVAALFGKEEDTAAEEEDRFAANMRGLFYEFVRTGSLPQNKDLTLGMYLVGEEEVATQRDYPACDFWKRSGDIVPKYASLH